ncbi:hypothetical protein B0E52_13665 [Rhodanobacter sp. C06]|uniref:hypothetical protein n=1 Tax=Rhodanobacter sp. C06 TaxID=1945854 RepID=UPI000985F22C|nr:hypothetical protein [Rhodanobacter sp. C06]OOG38867.1 hypothetical protein B0E52_13665 [Rhodanobacter sp. C06]
MSLFSHLDKVRAAQARVAAHRAELAEPAAALLACGERHPLLALGAAGGAGFVLGSLDVHPLRVPGVGPLLRGGLAEVVAQGVRLVVELGAGAFDDASA